MSHLLTFIDKKLKQIRGLTPKTITYSFDKHHKITEWLRKIGNISYNLDYEHNYEATK